MTLLKRKQLTLFVDEKASAEIEKIRKAFNPRQYELIKAHVTLCREDELEQIEKVIMNVKKTGLEKITLDFGEVARFSNNKGVFLPASGNIEAFQHLRKIILQGIIKNPPKPAPHITLMHPRNSSCTAAIFDQIKKCSFPGKISFNKISLIEQEIGNKWNIVEEFELIPI